MTDVQESNAKRGGEKSEAVRWLVVIGCEVGFLASIATLLPVFGKSMARFIMERPWEVVPVLIAPLGYLLVGWIYLVHWKTVTQRETMLVGAVAFVGTCLTLVSWPGLLRPVGLVFFVGFWLLNGFALAWLLRKLRRIMREANAE